MVVLMILISPNYLKIINPFQIFLLVMMGAGYSIFPIIYLYIAIKSDKSLRMNSLKVSAGSIFIALGLLFRFPNLTGYLGISSFLDTLIYYVNITAPISIMIGVFLIFSSYVGILKQ